MVHSVSPARPTGKPSSWGSPVVQAALAGLGFAVVESAGEALWGSPLDPEAGVWRTLGCALLLAALHALVAALPWPCSRRYRSIFAVLAWAAVWGPETARLAGQPAWLGALAPLVLLAAARWRLALALSALGGLALPLARPAWFEGPGPATQGRGGPDLLLVTVDTVRADAGLLSGPWAADDPLSPEQGFSQATLAVAPAPWTLPSMYSLMSGMPVWEHGGGLPVDGSYSARQPGTPSFAERLRDAGYHTVAVVSNPYLRASAGFSAGFDTFLHDDDAREPLLLWRQLARWRERWTGRVSALRHSRDARLVRAALAELARPSEAPRLVWVHLLGPHEYRRDPADPPIGWRVGTEDPELLRAAYRGNVAAARALVQQLVRAAPGWGVAVTADHGEAFGEGGFQGHGHALDDAELLVPLALRPPGAGLGHSLLGPLRTEDLGGTLLSWAGLEPPGADLMRAEPSTVIVGGLRQDAGTYAVRQLDGTYTPLSGGQVGRPGVPWSEDQRVALRGLGYEE